MVVEDPESEARYTKGRNGDHLMGVPFECELCHFRNLNFRNPNWEDPRDGFTLMAIRRANLDAMWGREPDTVKGNLNRLIRDHGDTVKWVSLLRPLPLLGNPKLDDRVGMAPALMTLVASLRKGKYGDSLQWDSMRKTQTWYGNAYDAGTAYVDESVLGREDKKQFISDSPTGGRWFSRFMRGNKLRMGVERRQNEAMVADILLALEVEADKRWRASTSEREKESIEETMCYAICEYAAGLRGEEVPLISLEGLLTFWEETASHDTPHIMLTLQGRFKGEVNSRWHCVPVADKTGSGVPVRKWMGRLVMDRRVGKQRRRKGWLFSKRGGQKGKMSDYDGMFKELLTLVKLNHPKVMPDSIKIEDFSLWRSGRRGATTEATNRNVDTKVIEAINRWRRKEAAKGAEAGLPMRQVYTAAKHTLQVMLQFSLTV